MRADRWFLLACSWGFAQIPIVAGVSGWRLLSCVALLNGCVFAPGVPRGPIREPGVTARASWGVAYGESKATYHWEGDPEEEISDGTPDMAGGFFTPSRVGAQLGLTRWFDLAADYGLFDGGLELRAGLPEGADPFPMALALELRRGAPFVRGDGEAWVRDHEENRLRLEFYPSVHTEKRRTVHLMFAAGGSFGRRYHSVNEPKPLFQTWEGPPGPSEDGAKILRNEVRLETAAGVEVKFLRPRKGTSLLLSVVAMPYLVLGSSDPRLVGGPYETSHRFQGSTTGMLSPATEPWQLTSYEQTWGMSFFVTLGVHLPFTKPRRDAR